MIRSRRHLFAALGFAALAMVCFGLLAWALAEGAVVQSNTGGSSLRWGSSSFHSANSYRAPNDLYTRDGDPGVYWKVVGALGFFGTLFTALAVLERGSFRISRDPRRSEVARTELLAKIDRACRLYPEGRDALLRARAASVESNSPALDAALDTLLVNALRVSDREAGLEQVRNLAKALDLAGKLSA